MNSTIPCNIGCKCVDDDVAKEFTYDTPMQIETSQTLYSEQQVRPTNGLTVHPYEFVIEPQENTFVVLSGLTLNARFNVGPKVVAVPPPPVSEELGEDGEKRPPAKVPQVVAPVNDVLASMWENAQVRINDHDFNPETGHFIGYKSYISKLLSYNKTAATQLAAGGFYPPGDKSIENAYPKLAAVVEDEKEVTYTGPLPLDICSLDNHLSPHTKLTITLKPHSARFFLHATGDDAGKPVWWWAMKDVFLQYRRISMPSPLTDKILAQAQRAPQRYLAPYTEMKAIEVPQGLSAWTLPVYPSGHVLPKQVVVAQVESVVPNDTKDPYRFYHYDLNYLAPVLDDVVPPNAELTPHFVWNGQGFLSHYYYRLFTETGKRNSLSEANLITQKAFIGGEVSIFPFDLTPDKCNSRHLHTGQRAKLDFNMRWRNPLPNTITVLVFSIFDQIITIDPHTGKPQSNVF